MEDKSCVDSNVLVKKGICPECGCKLVFQGGCKSCPNCGWEACGG